jgi:hypothetical protein
MNVILMLGSVTERQGFELSRALYSVSKGTASRNVGKVLEIYIASFNQTTGECRCFKKLLLDRNTPR